MQAPRLRSLSWLGLASKTPHLPTFATSSPLGSAGALEAARAAPPGSSKWPLEPARLRRGARNGHSSRLSSPRPGFENTAPADVCDIEPARLHWGAQNGRSSRLNSARPGFENTAPADVCDIEPARLHWGAQNGRSGPLGSAGALGTAARARSAPLGRSKWPLELARLRQGARNCSTWLLEDTAPANVAPLGRSTLALETAWLRPKSQLEPARLRWTGDASLGRTTNACIAQHRDEHSRAWYARVRTNIF